MMDPKKNAKIQRAKIINTARAYLGAVQGSAKHKKLIDTFNKVKPDGWSMTYSAYWCAATVSAWAIETFGILNAKKFFPLSANCGTIIKKAKSMKIWKESDAYKPQPGDLILYDWNDNGKGDNVGDPDHVGMVEEVCDNAIRVIEGNKNKMVGQRVIDLNGRYIRGFVIPDYARIKIVHSNAYYFRKELKKIIDYANKHHFKYVHEYNKCGKTWDAAKKLKRMTCQMAISYALQNAGFIPMGKSFYCKGKRIVCQNGYKLEDLKKIATITHPEKPPKKLKMKKGDITGYDPEHTMEYEGRKNGVPTWYSWGGADVGDKQPKVKDSYTKKKISTLIRLKGADNK